MVDSARRSKRELPPRLPAESEDLSLDHVDLLLDEVERALLLVDARSDEPDHRVLEGDLLEGEITELPSSVRELNLAIAELVDMNPSIQYELEMVSERVRAFGGGVANQLARHPHLLDLARLGMEGFFLTYPTLGDFDDANEGEEESDDSGRTISETYEEMKEILENLRSRVS